MKRAMVSLIAGLMLVAAGASAADLPLLHVDGKDIVDAQNKVMSMRGISLGGWLMMETWIPELSVSGDAHLKALAAELDISERYADALAKAGTFDDDIMTYKGYLERIKKDLAPSLSLGRAQAFWALVEKEPPIVDAVTLDKVWRARFGDPGAAELWEAFHKTWISEEDFKRAKDLGFNFVRVPFWYRWIEDDAAPGKYKDYGFQWLDKAIAMAKSNGLYVILDMHGAPGGQSPWEHTGELSRNELFWKDDLVQRTCGLWTAIAARYKDEPAVFAYECLNEPAGAKNAEDWRRVHDAIYKAIRASDPTHIVIMQDGYKTEQPQFVDKGFFPVPSEKGWANVVYAIHFYQTGDMAAQKKECGRVIAVAEQERAHCGVPLYIGEFNCIGDVGVGTKAMRMYCTAFNEAGLHWSPWTLKATDAANEKATLWGVYRRPGAWTPPNMHRDSKEAILDKISQLASANYKANADYANVLRKCLAQPVVAAKGVKPPTGKPFAKQPGLP